MGLQQGSLVPARAVADGTAAVARMVLPSAPGLSQSPPLEASAKPTSSTRFRQLEPNPQG